MQANQITGGEGVIVENLSKTLEQQSYFPQMVEGQPVKVFLKFFNFFYIVFIYYTIYKLKWTPEKNMTNLLTVCISFYDLSKVRSLKQKVIKIFMTLFLVTGVPPCQKKIMTISDKIGLTPYLKCLTVRKIRENFWQSEVWNTPLEKSQINYLNWFSTTNDIPMIKTCSSIG